MMPQQDSDDLSQDEVDRSMTAATVEAVVEALRGVKCSSCKQRLEPRSHELRRKSPHLYWRANLQCEANHKETRVFRVGWLHDWLHESS
jgi:hypothetical protein